MALWILLLFLGSSQAVNYFGSVMTYYPKYNATSGFYTVELRYMTSTVSNTCDVLEWLCDSGQCGSQISTTTNRIAENVTSYSSCQTEAIRTLQLSTNATFTLRMDGQSWVTNANNIQLIRGITLVDLRSRSDTGRANRPPQATIMSPLRIPSNCPRQINLLAKDPDGDQVLCRYATKSPKECYPCSPPSIFIVSPTCTVSFNPTIKSSEGLYAVEMVMEDYPRRTVTVTQTNGTQGQKTTSDYISAVPFQFALIVTPPVPSCTEGEYLPKFVDPTPQHGAVLYFTAGVQKQIVIQAQATAVTVNDLLFTGPASIRRSLQGSQLTLTWTPSEADGETFPLCFVAQAFYNDVVLYSEVRCVILKIGIEPTAKPVQVSGFGLTYYDTSTNGLISVNIRAKLNSDSCPKTAGLSCYSGICGGGTLNGSYVVDKENSGEFCQTETVYTITPPTNAPFEMSLQTGFLLMDLRNRSDTRRSNRPPLTTGPPVIRIPNNCARNFYILAYDEDNDLVKICTRYDTDDECLVCYSYYSFYSSTGMTAQYCSRYYSPTYYVGPYTISGTMKDFPNQNVTLTQTDGSQQLKTPSDALSKLPLSIDVLVEGPAPSCTVGEYLPQLLSPTPVFGDILRATVGKTLTIAIAAAASVSKISELLFSGPHGMKEVMVREGEFLLTWAPSEAEAGQSHPVCFVVEAVLGSRKYQSDARCVVVRVDPLASKSRDEYVAAADVRLSSSIQLTDADVEVFLQQVRAYLVSLGVPGEIVLERP